MDMVDRIKLMLKVNNMTASKFADEIGVQRSSISHILSGRNLPSLDLIQKVLRRFPEISSEWLLNGNGSMLRNPQPDLFNSGEPEPRGEISEPEKPVEIMPDEEPDVMQMFDNVRFEEKNEPVKAPEIPTDVPVPEPKQEYAGENELKTNFKSTGIPQVDVNQIEKIVIFYTNRTFREYFPEK